MIIRRSPARPGVPTSPARPQHEHADLGLGYPPHDQTEDLRPNTEMPPTGSRQEPQVEGNRFNHHKEIESYV